jgi:hypothetical protein
LEGLNKVGRIPVFWEFWEMSDLILDVLKYQLCSGTYKLVTSGGPKGAEWAGPCPVCGGDDRFRVWPNQEGGEAAKKAGAVGKWWCRQCDKGGDVIELLVYARGLSFIEACRELKIELSGAPHRRQALRAPATDPPWTPAVWPLPCEKWQAAATKLALEAKECLLTFEAGQKYLVKRGLPLEAAQQYGLGYLTGDDKTGKGRFRSRSVFGLPNEESGDKVKKNIWIPRGITVPLWNPGGIDSVLRLRIRRMAADIEEDGRKFMMLNGSCQAPMLLPPTAIAADRAVWVIVEAELCAMAVHFACQGRVGVMATLTVRGKPDMTAHKYLTKAPMILVALDFDPAKNPRAGDDGRGAVRPGFQGWLWWQKQYAQAKRWPVPLGKDPGEAVALGVDLGKWVRDALPKRAEKPSSRNMGDESESPVLKKKETAGPAGATGICRHDMSTWEYLYKDWDGVSKRYPVCYLEVPAGRLCGKSAQERFCGVPHGGGFEGLWLSCPSAGQERRRAYRRASPLEGRHCDGHDRCSSDFG